jgi:hypothetical protein
MLQLSLSTLFTGCHVVTQLHAADAAACMLGSFLFAIVAGCHAVLTSLRCGRLPVLAPQLVEELRRHGLTLLNYASIREQSIGGFIQACSQSVFQPRSVLVG